MKQLIALIVITLLATGCSTLTPPPATTRSALAVKPDVSTPLAGSVESLKAQLDRQVTSGGVVDTSKAFAGVVNIPTGTHYWAFPLYISTAQTVDGFDVASTLVIYNGAPGSSAITIWEYTGPKNANVHRPVIRNFQLRTTRTTNAVGKVDSVQKIDRLLINHFVTNGRINLPGENYRCILDDVAIVVNDIQALRLDGQQNVLRSVQIEGTVTDKNALPVVDLRGSAQFEGFSGIEGNFACKSLSLGPWIAKDGYVHPGVFAGGLTWHEQHVASPIWAELDRSEYFIPLVGGTREWRWSLTKGSALYVQRPPDAGAVVRDNTMVQKIDANGKPMFDAQGKPVMTNANRLITGGVDQVEKLDAAQAAEAQR